MRDYSLKLYSYKKLFDHFIYLELYQKLPSKILLSGQSGIGKTTLAFHLINYLISKNEINKYDTNENIINQESIAYNLVNNNSHPNFYLVAKHDAKKNIEIDQIRSMLNFLNKSSFNNDKKIVLIDGIENLNLSSSNALLKCLEEANIQNQFILTHNINTNILNTIKSRCLTYNLCIDYLSIPHILNDYFGENLYDELNEDFKEKNLSPKFLINHILFIKENKLNLSSSNIKQIIQYIINNKVYKKNNFIITNFQIYLEIYFANMYSKTRDYKHYENFIKIVEESDIIKKFNLDLDSFIIKFENKYFNI